MNLRKAPASPAAKGREMFMRVFRIALFMLCPVYIFWSYKMRTGNIFAWPEHERMVWLMVTLLWCLAWGFAALAYLRRLRMQMQRQRMMQEGGEGD